LTDSVNRLKNGGDGPARPLAIPQRMSA